MGLGLEGTGARGYWYCLCFWRPCLFLLYAISSHSTLDVHSVEPSEFWAKVMTHSSPSHVDYGCTGTYLGSCRMVRRWHLPFGPRLVVNILVQTWKNTAHSGTS